MRVVAERKTSAAMCPICGKPAVEALLPFCSRRCANVDLGRWLTGQYRVPAAANETEEESPPESQ